MSYSRRQLYALGEPLGDSATYKEGGRTIYGDGGGGGGGSQPTTSTAYQTNIPEYAKPYVETMLGSAQKQIYTMDGSGQVTGFKPYTPYSTNMEDYVAGFSPMQQQAFGTVANLQTPAQYGAATGLAGATGLGAMGLAGQMAQTGQRYAQQATDPSVTQAYMSPYMQNVVDYQKMQAARDYNIAEQTRRAQAVGAGAFGGSRQAIQSSEAQRALMSQLQGIQATGQQQAFQNAQQQQQFGAQLGLQGQQAGLAGLGQALQSASTLGQIGTSELGAQTNIAQLQSQMGAQQQQLEQQKINQAIQNYATAQQYPYMQLGLLNSLLRGLPMQSTTTSSYQATPSTAQQVAGLGLSGLGAYKALSGFKEGGEVKGLAAGGVQESVRAKLEMMTPEQLQQVAKTSQSAEVRAMAQEVLAEQQLRERAEEQARQAIAREQAPKPQIPQAGLAAAPAPNFEEMAGGGIVAFAEGGMDEEEDPFTGLSKEDRALAQRQAIYQRAMGVKKDPYASYRDFLGEQQKGLGQQKDYAVGMGLMDVGARIASTPGPWGSAIAESISGALPGFQKNVAEYNKIKTDLAKANMEVAREEQKEAMGRANKLEDSAEKRDELANRLKTAQISANAQLGAARISSERTTDLMQAYNIELGKLTGGDPARATPEQKAAAMQAAGNLLRGTETRLGIQQSEAVTKALKDDTPLQDLYKEKKRLSMTPKQAEKNSTRLMDLEDEIAAREELVRRRASRQPQQTAAAPTGGNVIDFGNLPK